MTPLESSINYHFVNRQLLTLALTTPSPNPKCQGKTNQRLEFLGDAVFGMVSANRLYKLFPTAQEGRLTDMRLHLVSGKALYQKGEVLELRKHLISDTPKVAYSNGAIADAVEAIMGALWLDGGLVAAEAFFDRLFSDEELKALEHCTGSSDNAKGELQMLAQKQKLTPVYTELSRQGPDHAPTFTCQVALGDCMAQGIGSSRQRAEIAAADALLALIARGNPETTQTTAKASTNLSTEVPGVTP